VSVRLAEPDVGATVREVAELLDLAGKNRARADRIHRRRFARLLKDPKAIDLTIRLTDEVIRIVNPREAARRFRQITKEATFGLGLIDFLSIKLA
jgi:RHH-type proline utilization regulon transcriptional repressor/proline dehydrogenase/delta 1-pyrroline-5-carboxylate dehydrogenase